MILGLLVIHSAAGGAEFFVSPRGRDINVGTRTRPFATLQRAQEAVRARRQATPREGVMVVLRGGTYALTETLVFGWEDTFLPVDRVAI